MNDRRGAAPAVLAGILLLIPLALPATARGEPTAREAQAGSATQAGTTAGRGEPTAAEAQAVSATQAGTTAARDKKPTAGFVLSHEQLHGLPGARDVWAVLEHWIPTVVTDRLDVGGSATGRQALFSGRGTSFGQNTFVLDGTDVTDPAVRGTSTMFFDYDALEQLDVSWGSRPAPRATAGVRVALALRSGTNELHGSAQGYFEHSTLQASNVSDDLVSQGLPEGAPIEYLSDVSFQLGGPLARDRAWFFGSYRDWRVSRSVPGFSETVRTDLPVFVLKATARPSAADSVAVFWTRQRFTNPFRGAGRFTGPEATLVDETTTNVIAGSWNRSLTRLSGGRLDVRGAFLDLDFPLALQPGATRQSRLDLVTGIRTGSASREVLSNRRRYSAEGHLAFVADASGAHALSAGAVFERAPTDSGSRAIGDVNIITSGGAALVTQLLNTPVESRQLARGIGLYINDDWSTSDRWSLSAGLRYDDWSGSLPAQSSPGGTYTGAREFAAQGDVIGWRALSPRAALAIDLLGDGRTWLVGAFAQYVHRLGTSTVNYGNPNSLGVKVVPWRDLNGDGQFQPGEGGPPVTVSGAAVGRIDPELLAPLSREVRLGLEHSFGGGWQGSVDLWYRKDTRLFDDVEVGLDPASDFAEIIVSDPGRDNIPGTEDDAGLIAFDQIENFGGNDLLLTTVGDKTVTYRGMDLGLRRELADNWELRAVLTLGLAEGLSPKSGLVPGDAGGISDLFNDPNSLTNANARLFWDRSFVLKAYGSYRFPYDIYVGGVARAWSAVPQARILPVKLNQGIVNIYAEPRGASRLEPLVTFDVRVAKELGFAGGARLGLFFDLFNAANAGTVIAENDTNPNFGVPTAIVSPRVARLGARLTF